jgi:hypothetical protein
MQICSGWPCGALQQRRFDADRHEFHGEFQSVIGFCTAAFSAWRFFYRWIKRLMPPFRARMTFCTNFARSACNRLGYIALYASLKPHQQGRHLPWTLP